MGASSRPGFASSNDIPYGFDTGSQHCYEIMCFCDNSICPISAFYQELPLVKGPFKHDKGTAGREAEGSSEKHLRFQGNWAPWVSTYTA